MTSPFDSGAAQPCVWMSAGLLTYKLCDRGLDCERCPLDAAMRGAPQLVASESGPGEPSKRPVDIAFPGDRLYSLGHTWVQTLDSQDGRVRLGLDGFAASLITPPRHVRWNGASGVVARGETICEIELEAGVLHLASPVEAQLAGCNQTLADDPAVVVTAPYDDGWVVDLIQVAPSELDGLVSAEIAQEQARLDLRRFRRRIALHLLAATDSVGATGGGNGEWLGDPGHMLDSALHLKLVRELVH